MGSRELSWETGRFRRLQPFNPAAPSPSPIRIPRMPMRISEDRAQLTGTCTKNQLVRAGSVESNLNGYFNASCFTKPPVIGADGIGTAFGNSGTGLVNGPGQANLDLPISRMQALPWLHEKTALQFRAEFFNAFNHPQFSNPDSNFSSPTFGVISNTSVSARVAQLALKLSF